MAPTLPLIRVLDQPGFRELERKLLLYSTSRGPLPAEVENAAYALAAETFHITREETEFGRRDELFDHSFSEEYRLLSAEYVAHESQYVCGDHLTDDETVEVLLSLGVDCSDDRNLPLLSTKLIARQAEAAARGIKGGRLPDRDAAELARLESELESDRDSFFRNRKRGRA